jgi:hypothetical protein
METKFYVPVVVNNIRVIAYFATNLAITLIRKSVAEGLKCVLHPVYGPDVTFVDPATARVFPLLWETRLTITTKTQPISSTAYVVQDEQIGASLIMGMDSIISMTGTITIDDEEHSNPLFPMPGDEKLLYPKPVWATGLGVSLASPVYASKSETAVVPYDGPDRYYDCVTRSHFPITGKINMPLPNNPNFCVLISKITTPIMLGLDYMRSVDFQLRFPDMCFSWPPTLAVRPYRPPARSIAGPTCPKCGLNGHVQSQCTGAREI